MGFKGAGFRSPWVAKALSDFEFWGAPRSMLAGRVWEFSAPRLALRVAVVVAAIMVLAAIVPAVVVSVVVSIPVVIVFKAAALTVPIAIKIPILVIVRPNPASAHIRRQRPIARVPSVVPSLRIPIAFYPHKIWSRSRWKHRDHARWWRRSDLDSNGHLSSRRLTEQESGDQQACPYEIPDEI